MSSERAFWNLLDEKLSPFGILHRIENRVGTGTPDVAYCLRRRPKGPITSGWLELKQTEWPSRSGTPFTIESLTLNQVQFLERWSKNGGMAFLLAQVDHDYLLWHPQKIRPILNRTYTSAEAIAAASLYWRSPWPRAKILDHLTRT